MRHDLITGAAGAAAYTGLPRRKIYRLVDDGHLPCVRKGRRLFFRKSELDGAFRHGRPLQRNPREHAFTARQWKDLIASGETIS